jgi:O-6-methylguanine DNA methyltransferase
MLDLFWDSLITDLGEIWLYVDGSRRVHRVSFRKGEDFPKDVHWQPARGHCDFLKRQLQEYFTGKRRQFDVECVFAGTPFQELVWRSLLSIPYGESISYSQLAKKISHPESSRAVGNALGVNPLAIIVPCHRVILKDGALGGYSGGLERKKYLLELEGGLNKKGF